MKKALDASTLWQLDKQLTGFPGAFEVLQEYQEDDGKLLSPTDSLMLLLENAIHHFGHSARDVYEALFNYKKYFNLHKDAFQITYKELLEAVTAFARGEIPSHNMSDRILSMNPVFSGPFDDVSWKVEFKSDWVAKCIVEELGGVEDIAMHQQIKLLQGKLLLQDESQGRAKITKPW
jgi:hypothetical protein